MNDFLIGYDIQWTWDPKKGKRLNCSDFDDKQIFKTYLNVFKNES